MIDLTYRIIGIQLWLWLFLFAVIFGFIIIMCIVFRKSIQRTMYKTFYPEKVLKILIHYPQGYFNDFYRLIPKDKEFLIDGNRYKYDDDYIKKHKEIFVNMNADQETGNFEIKGNKYNIDLRKINKKKWNSIPEIHYFYNVSEPIQFNINNKKLELSANQSKELKDNDLFSKLLSLKEEKMEHLLLIILVILNIILSIIIMLKQFGVFDKHTGA